MSDADTFSVVNGKLMCATPTTARFEVFPIEAAARLNALLAAAEDALTEIDDRYDYSDDKGEKPFAGAGQLMEQLRAAIAKARQS